MAIRIGGARSVDFSFLATAQSLSGDDLDAELTMADAVKLYPLSVFVLSRQAALCNRMADPGSNKNARSGEKLNRRDANTWWSFLNEGSNARRVKCVEKQRRFQAADGSQASEWCLRDSIRTKDQISQRNDAH
jgi:hypothetical protein